ncbi:MAG: hypothetical protein QXH91_05325, partial [Candidatus Bathyarchaeia archaeon]
MEKLSQMGSVHKLLEIEKQKRGVPLSDLVFIGMADTASFYWCPMKSLLANIDMEPQFFASYLHDRLLYSLKLGYVKKFPKAADKVLLVGEEITFADVEKLLKDKESRESRESPPYVTLLAHTPKGRVKVMVLNPSLSPELKIKLTRMAEKKRVKVVSLDDAPPKLRGAVYEEFLAERYPTIRWNFRWENYVVVGVPDGITDEFVYEFKTTGSEFLLGYIEQSALAQGDLYGYFFRRKNKRVQVYVVDEKETVTWHEEVNEADAVSLLKAFKQLDETREFSLPEKWKCNRCNFKR